MYWVKLSGRAPVATITCGHRVAQVSVRCPIFPLKDFTPHCIAQFRRHVDVYIIEENFPIEDERKVEIFSVLLDGDVDIVPEEEEFIMWLIANGFQPKGHYRKIEVTEDESVAEVESVDDVDDVSEPVVSISVLDEEGVVDTKKVNKRKGARRSRTNKRKRK